MASTLIGDILFVRRYPALLANRGKLHRSLRSWFDPRGITVSLAGHRVTFFRAGFGTGIRNLHPDIIAALSSGKITDIVDVGGGGALDPALKRGDIVLSSGDFCSDTFDSIAVKRRDEVLDVVRSLAAARKVEFTVGTILTNTELVGSRKQRLDLFEQTGCSVVQMEHGWFLRSLYKRLGAAVFSALHVTHMEVITDVVPKINRWDHTLAEAWHGILGCSLLGGRYLQALKRDFLRLWLSGS